MKRKFRCSTCGTTKNSATGKTLYLIGEREVPLHTADRNTECWDCGEARREAEAKRLKGVATA